MRARRPLSARSKLLASAALLGLLLAAVGAVVQSAFTSTVRNPGNTFEAGTIDLSDNVGSGTALFELRGLKPGVTASKCIKLTYGAAGGLAATVRLWGRGDGELAPHLRLKVVRGAFTGETPVGGQCSGFAASSAPPLYDGTLAAYPASYAAGLLDPDPAWTSGETAAYRIEVEVADSDDAQGRRAAHEFVFEARTI